MVDLAELVNTVKGGSTSFIIFYILLVIGQWMVFQKAGQAGWKSLIPIYNRFVFWRIAGKSFLKFLGITVLFIIAISILLAISASSSVGIFAILLPILYIALLVFFISEAYNVSSNLSRSFGHGTGFALGLFFLQPLFLIILGFNKDEYKGV